MAKSIIGFHYSVTGEKKGTREFMDGLNRQGIPFLVKGSDDTGLIIQGLEYSEKYKNTGVENWLIYRLSTVGQKKDNQPLIDYDVPDYTVSPKEAAQKHWKITIQKWPKDLKKEHIQPKVWMEPINEPRAKLSPNDVQFNNMDPVDWLGEFMFEFAQIANDKDYKVCGPSFNSGEPGVLPNLSDVVAQYSQPGMLKYLRYCAENPTKAALSIHEYSWDGWEKGESWRDWYPQKFGRVEAAIAAADNHSIPRTFPIFVTEWGFSGARVPKWPEAIEYLDAYNKWAAKWPQVKGVATWALQVYKGGSGESRPDLDLQTWLDVKNPKNLTNYVLTNDFPEGPQPAKTHQRFGGTLPQNAPQPETPSEPSPIPNDEPTQAPFDNKILLVNFQGKTTPGKNVDDLAKIIRNKMPNVSGVMLKTSNGLSWQGRLGNDSDAKAITGTTRIKEWVSSFEKLGLDVHVWGVPRAKNRIHGGESPDLVEEANKFIKAAKVSGVKSLLLDVEHGKSYWQGTPAEARKLMTLIREGLGDNFHIGLILDPRLNRNFNYWVKPWIPFVDSLHPMVYPILFGDFKTIEQHISDAFTNLGKYDKPIFPMLQAFGEDGKRPTMEQITHQGNAALNHGAKGISFFRLGSDNWGFDGKPHMGEDEYTGISKIKIDVLGNSEGAASYTWQDVINATTIIATKSEDSYENILQKVGFWKPFSNPLREMPYTGPNIEFWPIQPSQKEEILTILALDSQTIIRLTIEAQQKANEKNRTALAKRQKSKGSIIGIHGAPGVAAPPPHTWNDWIERLKEMGVQWYKQCDNGDPNDTGEHSIFSWAKRLKSEGIEPIIRYYKAEQFPDPLDDRFFKKMELFAAEGIVWAEIGNEPNLEYEWKSNWHTQNNHTPMSHTNPEAIRRVAESWLNDAQRALDAGVRPAFYAFAPTDWRGQSHPQYSSVFYTQKVVNYLATHHRNATLDIFNRGGWIAVHAATYEQPVDFDINRPDGPIWDMTLRSYEVVLNAFEENFGSDLDVNTTPVMSTEGGVFTPDSTSMSGHSSLKSDEEHARRVVEMYQWIEKNSPLQAMCPWCISVGSQIGHYDEKFRHDGWFEETNKKIMPRPVYNAMRQMRFDRNQDIESLENSLNAIKLDVPYHSQFDPTAITHNADCGPTCLAMLLNAQKPDDQHVTVDQLYTHTELLDKKIFSLTGIQEMIDVAKDYGLNLQRRDYLNAQDALKNIKELINQGTPPIALVNYTDKWNEIVKEHNFTGGHFVVITGYDDKHIFVHDPLFRGDNRHKGKFFVWRYENFMDGWGRGTEIGNPNFCALIPNKIISKLE